MMSENNTNWNTFWRNLGWEDEVNPDEVTRRLLRRRAQQYAAPSLVRQADNDQLHQIVVFELGSEIYGVDVMVVRMVRTIGSIAVVPGAPTFYPGVVNVRGQIITVMDLRYFFNMAVDTEQSLGELIVVRANQLEIGLLAHHIRDVLIIPASDVEKLNDLQYAVGMTANRIILLDIAHLFEDDRLIIGSTND